MTRRAGTLESKLKEQLLLAAPREVPELRIFVRDVGAARALHGEQVIKFGIKGMFDLYGLVRGGRHVEIELKSETGKVRPEQEVWAAFCATWGIPHVVLQPNRYEAVEKTIERWCAELRAVVASR
jgi:hypothetical protein